ncbi:MAG TPA: PKD domain-containing protein, partial [Bacteroidia bacterium]|nr:PKD domain-containing protein [Bacteroidia bacterium]
WTTSGDGTFPQGNNLLTTDYLPGTNDLANGNVMLVFNSTNNGGCQQQHDTLFVTIIPAPQANFTSISECPGTPMQFTDASTSVTPIISWNWNFGNPPLNNTSTFQNPSHAFPNGGSYNVTLVVTSENGCPDSVIIPTQVYPVPATAFTAQGFCLIDGTVFTDSSTIPLGTISTWQWDFGDGNTATGNPTSHTYASSGTWNVTLITTSNFGCKDTLIMPVVVYPSPTAAFSAAPSVAANTTQIVQFTDQSYFNITSWWWNFGDSSSIVTQQNPTHSWTNSGTYPITLIVVDTNGCTDTLVQDYIITAPPVAPTGFSPNGDGQNDFFIVRGGPFTNLELRIYNNWGELIYTGTEQYPGWDGKRD